MIDGNALTERGVKAVVNINLNEIEAKQIEQGDSANQLSRVNVQQKYEIPAMKTARC